MIQDFLKYIESFADKVVDYLEGKNKVSVKDESKPEKLEEENLEYVYYEIIPYHENQFGQDVFLKLLNNFSYYSNRINFYIYGNNSYAHLVISFPQVLEKKFITNFYNFFPSSKLQKIDELNFQPSEYFYVVDDAIKIKQNKKFFSEFFFLFKDIPLSEEGFIKYSLVLNSTEEENYSKGLIEIIWDFLKLVVWGIYYVIYRIFIGQAPKKKLKKTKGTFTGIKGTAISIGVGGNKNFIGLSYKYLSDNILFPINKSQKEIFSAIKKEEFVKLFYVPTKTDVIPLLSYITYKRLPPPPNLPKISKDTTILGVADWADESIKVGLKQEDKARHVYIVGKTGVGKSTLLSNMVYSDLENGRGLALIDPHGDLVETILKIIPENRMQDVVLFDVSDTLHPVGFNPFYKISQLSAEEKEKNKDLVVSTILSVFKKLYSYSWGPRLEYILRNVLITLTDYPGANFLDIIRLLTDKNFRKQVVSKISDPVMKNFWQNEFSKWSERFASEAISPILNKIGQFVSSGIIRNIFGQTTSTIDIQDIMNTNKIFLVNLSKGLVGEDNSALIGSFIVSQIQVETMKRAALDVSDRNYFSLYIDEFQNFATDSFAVILSEARKYNLSLIVANQYISQIDETIQNAIFGNVGNIVVFNSGNQDAEILVKQFKNKISVNDIVSIPKFKAYSKIMIDGISTDVFGLATFPISSEKYNLENVKKIRTYSQEKYSLPKEQVERQINLKLNLSIEKNEVKSEKKESKSGENKVISENQKSDIKNISTLGEDIGDIFEGVVKLKFNYGLFVVTDKYEGLLHKKNINLPEGINWKDYYNVGDKIKVKLVELKEVDGQVKAVWESI